MKNKVAKKEHHEKFMRQCLALAEIALQQGDPPVGAILVCEEEIIGKGIEAGKSTGDVTRHAEILAIKDAIAQGKQNLLQQSALYTTHEPCLMCSYVIRHHHIPHIIFGVSVDFVGGFTSPWKVLQTEQVPQWGQPPKVTGGICVEECQQLTQQFQKLLHPEK